MSIQVRFFIRRAAISYLRVGQKPHIVSVIITGNSNAGDKLSNEQMAKIESKCELTNQSRIWVRVHVFSM